MAGGFGSRLGHLTESTPKPLLKIGNKPMLEIIIENLRRHGIKNFIITTHYLSEMIVDYLKMAKNMESILTIFMKKNHLELQAASISCKKELVETISL